jgi:hypothetical protein
MPGNRVLTNNALLIVALPSQPIATGAEELHASEVDKMLRKPGNVAAFRPAEHLPGNRI